MLTHSLQMAVRSLARDKLYAAINIIGFALAIASCLVLGLYLYGELSYDRHHLKHERIFRIADSYEDYDTGNQRRELALTSQVLGGILARDNPEIEAYVRVLAIGDDVLVKHADKAFYWSQAFYADANIFDVFTHEIVYGDAATALVDPASVAVSRKFAELYFGAEDPVGETITLDDGEPRTITLVFEDLPDNTHLRYDVLFSYNHPDLAVAETDVPRFLFGVNSYTYLLMPENYDPADFAAISTAFYQRYMEQLARERTNRAWSGWLQPLTQIHLGDNLLNDEPTGNRNYLYGFAAVAIFILLIACINYMNLATAGFAKRARETGIRKILGAGRGGLALQFLGEALVLAVIALLLGVLMVELAINEGSLGNLFGKHLDFDFVMQPALLWIAAGGTLLLGLLSGLYPAAYLSSLRPLVALVANRRSTSGKFELRLRELLLLLQFTISIGVIACTLLMLAQMRLVADQPLGFSKDNRILLTVRDPAVVARLPVLRDELLQDSQIVGVAYGTSMMGQDFNVNSTSIETSAGTMEPVQMGHMAVSSDFVNVMGMTLAAGRNFSPDISTDAASAVLVNQALVDYMGWDEPLGKTLQATWGSRATVIGVVENFNFRSLHSAVEPFFLYQPEFSTAGRLGSDRQLVISIVGDRTAATLDFIAAKLKEFSPAEPFAYQFLDESLAELYLSEQRLMYLIGIFASICLVITSMGLFGLTTFTTEQRTKEIGIRKVLGASRWQVVILLLRRTMLLTAVAAGMAAAVVYPIMNDWLGGFAYRVGINPAVFAVSAVSVLVITYGTVAIQTLRIANLQPVRTLRYE